jgi:hypothetical protein
MIYKLLWKYFGKKLIKFYLADQNKPIQLSQLVYAFSDSKGKKYYRFPENVALPFDRYGKLMEYLTLISSRLTAENLALLCDKALAIVTEGISKEKNAAKVAAIIYQLKERKDWIVPAQLIYDVLCLQYIREDEQPDKFDNGIHMQKIELFMNEISKSAFFLRMPEFQKLLNSTTMSESEWTEYYLKSIAEDKILKETLKIYS